MRISAARLLALILGFSTLVALAGCQGKPAPETSAAIAAVLAGKPVIAGTAHKDAVWGDVHAFYTAREGAPAWVDGLAPSKRAKDAIAVLRAAPTHGLRAEDYEAEKLSLALNALGKSDKDSDPSAKKPSSQERLRQLADFDVRLSTALLSLGRDVAIGRTTPDRIATGWTARRDVPDLVGTLNGDTGDLKGWLNTVEPPHAEYAALEKALAGLRATAAADAEATEATFYDMTKKAGIAAFQEHHGLKATGVADKATLAAAKVPLAFRIAQVEVNMERWRWMPDDLGDPHLLVNIPLYHVLIREHGKTTQDIRVVVGKTGHETPIFSGDMTTVVFSPYWNIPESIVEGETAPKMAKDPQYLARNNIEILRRTGSGSEAVAPSQVDWNDPQALKDLAFRQKPGSSNALGHVKFLFPNKFNVYLHDSPAEELFTRVGRAFSHGCVRVEEPETLAKYVLRDNPDWPVEKIFKAMNSGVETSVTMKKPLPVHIAYFTAWVDEHNGLHFQPDVYGYDAKQIGGA